ncbi:hypothetical protein OsI_24033 [Oryza sativa Indica Group]|uniref:DUF4283 domain-containing protein n=1 Tax=Oryza sativa subsp. indica TaxID=39946 RepID=B8B187_ORYSI|nr:hypothetical protein OsI_24033 [Oryza sativa Indica Group]
MRAPPSVTAKDVERVLADEFGLRSGEIAMSLHFREAFLLKFKHHRHCEEAVKKGFAKGQGIEVHFIQWRSLKNAAGSALMYRVKLCLDGVPMHLWAPDIAERIISRTCTLESVETDLVHPVDAGDTRVISLWAWMPNPSRIDKRVWVTITRQTRDPLLESVTISETPPEHWQQGVKHPVLFHIEEIHDYTAAAVDLRNPKSCRLATRTLPPGHLGVLDGQRAPPCLFENFPHHPPTPTTYAFRQGRAEGVEDNAGLAREPHDQGSRTAREAAARDGGWRQHDGDRDRRREDHDGRRDDRDVRRNADRRRERRGRYNNDHPGAGHGPGWRRDDDDDEERGHGRDVAQGRGGLREPDVHFRRERTRSPRARDRGGNDRRDGRRRQDDICEEPGDLGGGDRDNDISPGLAMAGEFQPPRSLSPLPLLRGFGNEARPVAPTDTLALDDPANAEQAEPARQAAANDPVDDLQATLGPTVQPEAAIHTPMLSTSAVDFPQCADVNLQTPPPPMPRQDRHRSSRLAQQPTVGLPSGLKAQLNLCRRMGLTPEEGTLTDKVVADFKAMFNAPLPQDTIDALEQLFGLNREDAKAADAVLAKYLGPTDACYREELAAAT